MVDSQLHAPRRIGLNQIDEFPGNDSRFQLSHYGFNRSGRSHALQQAPHRPTQTNVDLGNFEIHTAIRRFGMQINIIDADDLASMNVDDLLVEEVSF